MHASRQVIHGEFSSVGGSVTLGMSPTHAVQFYEDDDFLVTSVGDFLGSGLAIGQEVVVVATAPHRAALQAHLEERAFDVERAMLQGQLALVDADELLATFMVGDRPDAGRFLASLDALFHTRGKSLQMPTVRVFDEMVDVLSRAARDRRSG